jgi:hypothetical protein
VTTAFYFGIPAARGLLNDSWWFHYPAATLVEDLKYFPLPSVFAPDDPLYYHFRPRYPCWYLGPTCSIARSKPVLLL